MRALFLLMLSLTACSKKPASPSCSRPELTAFASPRPVIDGELEETNWVHTPSTGAFPSLAEGKPVSPHTELRALWSPAALFLAIYSADQDLRSNDSVHVRVASLDFSVAASGKISGAPASVQAAVERDGSLDVDEAEDDEEWVAEVEVPWAALGLERAPSTVDVGVWREDTPRDAKPRTVSWARSCEGTPAEGTVRLRPPAAASP